MECHLINVCIDGQDVEELLQVTQPMQDYTERPWRAMRYPAEVGLFTSNVDFINKPTKPLPLRRMINDVQYNI